MSGEILSGLIGGAIGPLAGKILGRFRVWKVFAVCLLLIYMSIFVVGAFYVGPRQSLLELKQFIQPRALLIFSAISAGVAFLAFLGRSAKNGQKKIDANSSEACVDDKSV
ncbi:hypothetical protein K7N18_26205 [Burkholderia arboris]|uniref:hypothetical protein n=1 Tax=Burkholderia arboris TaxID=488730 RepID=UPI001CA41F87|nr:hypothetical protein [Burkholderia arboris]MBY8608324.1 hypothetical protein [Burkholderia arboris]